MAETGPAAGGAGPGRSGAAAPPEVGEERAHDGAVLHGGADGQAAATARTVQDIDGDHPLEERRPACRRGIFRAMASIAPALPVSAAGARVSPADLGPDGADLGAGPHEVSPVAAALQQELVAQMQALVEDPVERREVAEPVALEPRDEEIGVDEVGGRRLQVGDECSSAAGVTSPTAATQDQRRPEFPKETD